jgi:hypothetical protein
VLPKGMAVEQATAVVVKLSPKTRRRDVRLVSRWLGSPPGPGSPASGQWLDAQSWEADSSIVVIGTEDFEALAARLPRLCLKGDDHPVTYQPDGLEVALPNVPAGQLTSLHFIVAVNALPEPVECSAWFAVDVPHGQLLAAASES